MPKSVKLARIFALAAAMGACVMPGLLAPGLPAEAQNVAAANGLPPGALEVNLVEITDPRGFERPMTAAKVLVPKGWRTEGGVVWNQSTCGDMAMFNWSASSPDGLHRIELIPTEAWAASNSIRITCQYGEYQDMRGYLAAYIQNRVPGARIGQYKSRPDFLDLQKDFVQAQIDMVNNSGIGARAGADAGEMTYTARRNGTEIEGVVGATAIFMMGQTPNPFGPPLVSLNAQTTSAFAASGPKGRFDRQMAEAVRKSVKTEAEWAQKYFELKMKVAGIQLKGVRERTAIIVAAGAAMTAATVERNRAASERAVTNSYADPSYSNEATEDRMQRERIEGIRGVETYDDPVYGGTVQLDATYNHAWRVNNSDSYILTNDPNFNPGAYSLDAQQLQRTR